MDLESRLKKLESRCRTLSAILIAIAGLACFMGNRAETEGIIKARQFFLMDDNGKPIGVWGPTKNSDGYEFSFDSSSGENPGSVMLLAKKAGGAIAVRRDSKAKVILMAGKDGSIDIEIDGELKSIFGN